jgi:hypothetical protein
VFIVCVYVAQKAVADECWSWRRQLSALQIRGVVAGTEDVVLDVVMWMEDEVVVLFVDVLVDVLFDDELVEVDVTLEDDDESGDSETQRTWPMERSQLVSREGL